MAGWAVWLALAGGVLVVVAPVLHRVSVLPLGPALLAVPVGILISLVALLLSVTVLVGGRPMPAGRGRVLGAATFSALTGLLDSSKGNHFTSDSYFVNAYHTEFNSF